MSGVTSGAALASVLYDGITVTLLPQIPQLGRGVRIEMRRGEQSVAVATSQLLVEDDFAFVELINRMHGELVALEHAV